MRDWGHARDYCNAMHKMFTCCTPDNYVTKTEEGSSVRKFLKLAFEHTGIQLLFRGSGLNENGLIKSKFSTKFKTNNVKTAQEIVRFNPTYYRRLDVPSLQGNASKFKYESGWKEETSFKGLVKEMIDHDAMA